MNNRIRLLNFFCLLCLTLFLFSCETTTESDRAANVDTSAPAGSETIEQNNGTNNASDTGSGNAVYEPGPVKDDFDVDYNDGKTTRDYNENSKSNGVREPNEYPSGRTGGQYVNPKTTTTPSGTNTNENPATGSPSKSGSSGK